MKYELETGLSENFPAREIRKKVFMEEQGFQNEFDDLDLMSDHVVVYDDDQAVGCGRTYLKPGTDDTFIIGRIAVLKEYRKKHIGREILTILEEHIVEKGGKMIELSAQLHACPFYEKCGYHRVGDIYFDEHCEHIKMVKYI